MHTLIKMTDLDLRDKVVLVREDYNVPLKDGVITSEARIRASLPTLRHLLEHGAKIILLSHLGRPRAGAYDAAFSLQPVAECLGRLLGMEAPLIRDWHDGIDMSRRRLVLCENMRFEAGETKNDAALARRLARLCDIYVNDAFATAHRAQASTHGVAQYVAVAAAGPLLIKELEALGRALRAPARPLVAIVGGAKVSGKLTLLENLLGKVDQIIVGGGIANTFLKAAGHEIGQSLHEADLVGQARRLLQQAGAGGAEIPLPVDVVSARAFTEDAEATNKSINEVGAADMIMDAGPRTAARLAASLATAGTIVWNGPLGVFEFDQFSRGTQTLARALAESSAYSIAGGGDTLAAISKFGVAGQISYISTGGGAFLEFLEGRKLPAIAILEEAARGRAKGP